MSEPSTGAATAQQLVEEALARATLPVVVRLTERWEANLRWAANELTTNGEMHGRTLTVVATAPVEGGTAVGTLSQEVTDVEEVQRLLRRGDVRAAVRAYGGDLLPGTDSPALVQMGDYLAVIAADLLALAEHGERASSILITAALRPSRTNSLAFAAP